MIIVKKIKGVWAVVNEETKEIIECFDTKYEAEDYYEPYRIKETLKEFDRDRRWKSLWDVEDRT